jgi:hypothetical protein
MVDQIEARRNDVEEGKRGKRPKGHRRNFPGPQTDRAAGRL